MSTTQTQARQAQELNRFDVEELLALILETNSIGAAHRMAQAARERIQDARDANAIDLGRSVAEERRLENSWIF